MHAVTPGPLTARPSSLAAGADPAGLSGIGVVGIGAAHSPSITQHRHLPGLGAIHNEDEMHAGGVGGGGGGGLAAGRAGGMVDGDEDDVHAHGEELFDDAVPDFLAFDLGEEEVERMRCVLQYYAACTAACRMAAMTTVSVSTCAFVLKLKLQAYYVVLVASSPCTASSWVP